MKFTSPDMMDLRLCTALDAGRFNILYGHYLAYFFTLMEGSNILLHSKDFCVKLY